MNTVDIRPTLRKGGRAYYLTTGSGVVKCDVLSVVPNTEFPGFDRVTLRVTARKNKTYPLGYIIETNSKWGVPRGAYDATRFGARITAYNVEFDK